MDRPEQIGDGISRTKAVASEEELQAGSDIAAYLSDNLKAALQLFVQRVRG
jgi:hypothetical protein